MSGRPRKPPPYLRPDLRDDEHAAIVAAVGPLSDGLARAIRDGRGEAFQRLEFLGDSVLDLLLTVHAVVEPDCPHCRAVGGDVARLVTDQRLAQRAAATGFGSWLEWDASGERLADLVEACVAAAWLAGSWPQAVAYSATMVHPIDATVVAVLIGESGHRLVSTSIRAERRVGASILELAAAHAAFDADPDADEGELSRVRAANHRTARVAAHARRTGIVDARGDDAVVSNRVEGLLAAQLRSDGADYALTSARDVLG
jgi:dsRNA-specific ribonuclease